MDERVRSTTARRVRQIVRSAAEETVVPLHRDMVPPSQRSKRSPLHVLIAIPLLALLPMGDATPTRSKPVSVSLYQPDMNCGISKFRMAECNPNEYVVEVLLGGRPHRSPGLSEREEFPVF